MKKYDYIILGAGISGLSFARMLQQQNTKTFLVLEKENEPGGLCRSKNVDGNWFDTGGGHFLCSKHKEVYEFIFSHVPQKKFNTYERITKIKIHDTYIDYPIEDNLWQLPAEIQIKYLHSIIKGISEKEPENFEQWIIKNLGSEIYNNYLKPYNEKLWGVSVSEMDTDWVYKIPKTDILSILKSVINKQADKGLIPSHQHFYYPKRGGFQIITDAIYEQVKKHVNLNEPVDSLYHDDSQNKWIVNKKYHAERVINTLPWTALSGALKPMAQINYLFNSLKHNKLVVSLHEREYSL